MGADKGVCNPGIGELDAAAEELAYVAHQAVPRAPQLGGMLDPRHVAADLSALARKCGDVCQATTASSSWDAERLSISRERSWRVNFHAKGWAMAS